MTSFLSDCDDSHCIIRNSEVLLLISQTQSIWPLAHPTPAGGEAAAHPAPTSQEALAPNSTIRRSLRPATDVEWTAHL